MQHVQFTNPEEMLRKAVEIVTKVDDPELEAMLYRFDHVSAPDIDIDVNDQLKIYNWLQELKLYRKLHGPLGG